MLSKEFKDQVRYYSQLIYESYDFQKGINQEKWDEVHQIDDDMLIKMLAIAQVGKQYNHLPYTGKLKPTIDFDKLVNEIKQNYNRNEAIDTIMFKDTVFLIPGLNLL
jgi:hypothetical protein